MVRRGSTVRVRQRALTKAPQPAGFRSSSGQRDSARVAPGSHALPRAPSESPAPPTSAQRHRARRRRARRCRAPSLRSLSIARGVMRPARTASGIGSPCGPKARALSSVPPKGWTSTRASAAASDARVAPDQRNTAAASPSAPAMTSAKRIQSRRRRLRRRGRRLRRTGTREDAEPIVTQPRIRTDLRSPLACGCARRVGRESCCRARRGAATRAGRVCGLLIDGLIGRIYDGAACHGVATSTGSRNRVKRVLVRHGGTSGSGPRFRIELGAAAASALLLLVTVVWPAWIEAVTGFDPDRSSGALEWGIVFVLLGATVICSVLARQEWRKLRAA